MPQPLARVQESLHIALLLVLASTTTLGQSCQPLRDPTCGHAVPVGTDIFVPAWSSLEQLQTLSNREVGLVNFSPLPDPCFSAALQIICLSYLRPCQKINNDGYCIPLLILAGVPFGAGMYFPPNTYPPLNCSNPPSDSDAQNSYLWAPPLTTFTYEGQNYTLPCSQSELAPPPWQLYCGAPLSVVTVEGHQRCGFTCPLPSLTEDQYDSVKVMQGIVGWMSWAGAIILPTMIGYDNIWCGGSDQYLTPALSLSQVDPVTGYVDIGFSIDEEVLSFSSDPCAFQGAILQFGFLAAVFWWVIIAFNMTLEKLPLETRWWKIGRFTAYNLTAWGLAFLLMVIPAAAGQIKFASAATYCFLTLEDNSAWILTFWFIPVGIALLTGVVLFILALVRVTILLITIKKVKELLLLHLRMFIFIFLYLFLFVLIFAYYIQYEKDKDDIETGYETYFKCIIFAEPVCSLSESVSNYDLVMLKGWAISSLGVLLFMLFLLGPITKFWYLFFKGLWLAIYFRKLSYAAQAIMMVKSNTRSNSLSMKSENSLSVMDGGGPEEEGDEVTGEDEVTHGGDEEENNDSSSSGTD